MAARPIMTASQPVCCFIFSISDYTIDIAISNDGDIDGLFHFCDGIPIGMTREILEHACCHARDRTGAIFFDQFCHRQIISIVICRAQADLSR